MIATNPVVQTPNSEVHVLKEENTRLKKRAPVSKCGTREIGNQNGMH